MESQESDDNSGKLGNFAKNIGNDKSKIAKYILGLKSFNIVKVRTY